MLGTPIRLTTPILDVEVRCLKNTTFPANILALVALTNSLVPPEGGMPTLVWWPSTFPTVATTPLKLVLLVVKPSVLLQAGKSLSTTGPLPPISVR